MTFQTPMLFDDRALPQNRNGAITKLSDADIAAKFLELWRIYPQRAGNNPKYLAEQKFARWIKSGENAETIIDGARRFASECLRRRIIGTCYVPQMVTWLNGKMWLNDPDAGPVDEQQSQGAFADVSRKLREAIRNNDDSGDDFGR